MTTKEFREEISKTKYPDWYKGADVTIDYPHIGFRINLEGLSSLHKFLSNQINGWDKFETLPNEFKESKQHFMTLKSSLERFLANHREAEESQLNNSWRSAKSTYAQNRNYFTYDSPQAEFLIKIFQELPNAFEGAYKYIIGSPEIHSKDKIIGTILGYEFDLKDNTEIVKRRDKEKATITKLRNDLRELLSETEIQTTENINQTKEKFDAYTKKIDELKENKESLFDEWFKKSKQDFSEFDDSSKEKINDLEKLYLEKLKLEAPARYWKIKSDKYYKEGKESRRILIWVISVTGVFMAAILLISPTWIFENIFKENATAVIRWSLIFIALLSLVAYTVKSISKVMFSSYHLARDAEERHTLTYFYLALLKDSAAKEEDKNLILQALFSRVDTGLLKDDAGPTMPHESITRIIGK